MNNNFEKEVYYFIELVFNNIHSAKTKKNKKKLKQMEKKLLYLIRRKNTHTPYTQNKYKILNLSNTLLNV